MNKKVTRHIIQDEPSNKDLFRGGGHERTAHSLSRAIVKFSVGDSAIGLDGSWGSGKSSVVEMASRKLKEQNGKGKKSYHFFTFDIWKSQGSGFRRSYLEHFLTWAKKTFPKKSPDLDEIERQVQGKTREIQTNNQPILDWYGIGVLFFLPFLPLYYFWAKKVFDELSKTGNSRDFLASAPFLMLAIFVVGTFILAWGKNKFGPARDRQLGFKATISRLLLISSRQHQDHKVVQKVREIDPNDYEFHATLREILGVVQSDKDRVVMVLDNIDRLPRKEIKEYWALVRSIFSRSNDNFAPEKNTDITAIVPYDRRLIETHVNEEDADEAPSETSLSSLKSRELFSKTFDEILMIAPPVLSNAREFFVAKLEEALPKQIPANSKFRTYRIFCELLNLEGGTTTPREIVTFVNDLSSLYELHDGKFGLPTVAAYLAHQDLLTEDPTTLNLDSGLDQKIASLTADEGLVRNLAAMVFNVDEELAFQILLDEEISSAIVADTSGPLIQLSAAPGFDLRIDDVLQGNMEELRSTGEFGVAVQNICDLLETYKGEARQDVQNAILEGFERVDALPIENEEYFPYLSLFAIAGDERRPEIVAHFAAAIFEGVSLNGNEGFQQGKNLASCLKAAGEALKSFDATSELKSALSNHKPPSLQKYMFGLASNIVDAGFNLGDFEDVDLDTSEEVKYLEEEFVKYPNLAVPALLQLDANNLLTEDELLEIANACLTAMEQEVAKPEHTGKTLEIVTLVWEFLTAKRRAEIKLDDALTSGDFFRNVGSVGSENSLFGQANLLFLAQGKLGQTLSPPTKLNANNSAIADTSDAFEAFNAILEGNKKLTEGQVAYISDKAVDVGWAGVWIVYGKGNREHEAVEQIVAAMFEGDNLPRLKLEGLISHYEYIEDLFDTDKLDDILQKFGQRVALSEVEKLKLEDLPTGFLKATSGSGMEEWNILHTHVEQLLRGIPSDAWLTHLENMEVPTKVLIEKLNSSDCSLDSGTFRKPMLAVVKGVLSGQTELEAAAGTIDRLMGAIDTNYHEDIWRTLREEMSGVTAQSLENSMQLFPDLMENIASNGAKISKSEKDNVVRNLLIPALEGGNAKALQIFVKIGYSKVKVFKDASEASSAKMLEGALNSFSESSADRDLIRTVNEAVVGKRKAKLVLDPSYWLPFGR